MLLTQKLPVLQTTTYKKENAARNLLWKSRVYSIDDSW
jgi:hypothetical protein